MRCVKILLLAGSIALALGMPHFSFAADDGAKIFEAECSVCHNPKKKPLDKLKMSRAKWKEAIDEMIEKDKLDDPLPSKERISQLLDWLAATYGPADNTTEAAKK
ncbi:MAG: hypothetical protein NT159_06530 [Proteobacteria bacterium]|nr:hypothetical protein [Pseudomonadota bacterium]